MTLQKEAVAQLVKHHEASAAWLEVTDAYRIPDWQYRKAFIRRRLITPSAVDVRCSGIVTPMRETP
jgi:hypothetical protein